MYTKPKLRNYQQKIKQQISVSEQNVCIQSDTGTGKSIVMMDYALEQITKGKSILIIVPSIELLENLERYVSSLAPIIYKNFYGAINSKRKFEQGKKLYIGTFLSIKKYQKYIKPDIIIHDEAHHTRAKNWQDLIDYWHDKRHIGFTATPIRYDGKSLKPLFPELICSESTEWFIDNGYLSNYRVFTDPLSVQFAGSGKGDELDKQQQLWEDYDLVGHAFKTWCNLAYGEQTIIFATGENHANFLLKEFGDLARVVTGKTPNRTEILKDFDNKKFPVLININLLIEGVDVKECTCVQLLRKTFSLSVYRQMIGRGLRIDKNNPNKILKILDHAGNIDQHLEPRIEIDWYELYEETPKEKIENFDKDTLDYTCVACTFPIAKLGEIKGQNVIICPCCGHPNVVRALSKTQLKTLNIADMELVEYTVPVAVQKISKIVNSPKMGHQAKISAILKVKQATRDQKLDGLIKIGVSGELAKVYAGV